MTATVSPAFTFSPSFVAARDAFALWYDALDTDKQELVDSISERTHYIIEEQEYLDFIDLLDEEFGIQCAMDFEDKFEAEFAGYGDSQLAEYAENMVSECYNLRGIPEFVSLTLTGKLSGTVSFVTITLRCNSTRIPTSSATTS